MSLLYATVTRQHQHVLLLIHGPCGCIHTAEIVPDTRSDWTRAEFNWAHEKTGIPRADLYDAVRDFNRGEKVSSHAA